MPNPKSSSQKKYASQKRSKSSQTWLKEHFDDPYVKQSWKDGYRSRAAYKLLELQEKYKIIKPNMQVVDLGAAPGSWSQLAREWVGKKGKIIALDILPINELEGVFFLQGDFTDPKVEQTLEAYLNDGQVDVVMSDMAPNMSGQKTVDQLKGMYLAEISFAFAEKNLKPGGDFLIKIFHGAGFDEFLKQCRTAYHQVFIKKPDASRDRSPECYLLARGKK